MNKKELIISLMKLDRAYGQKLEAIETVLECELTDAQFFNKKDDDGKKIKDISGIVFEYVGIPKDNYDEVTDTGYCRDFVYKIYFSATFPLGEEKITIEKAAEILISAGENKGNISAEHEKYLFS